MYYLWLNPGQPSQAPLTGCNRIPQHIFMQCRSTERPERIVAWLTYYIHSFVYRFMQLFVGMMNSRTNRHQSVFSYTDDELVSEIYWPSVKIELNPLFFLWGILQGAESTEWFKNRGGGIWTHGLCVLNSSLLHKLLIKFYLRVSTSWTMLWNWTYPSHSSSYSTR